MTVVMTIAAVIVATTVTATQVAAMPMGTAKNIIATTATNG